MYFWLEPTPFNCHHSHNPTNWKRPSGRQLIISVAAGFVSFRIAFVRFYFCLNQGRNNPNVKKGSTKTPVRSLEPHKCFFYFFFIWSCSQFVKPIQFYSTQPALPLQTPSAQLCKLPIQSRNPAELFPVTLQHPAFTLQLCRLQLPHLHFFLHLNAACSAVGWAMLQAVFRAAERTGPPFVLSLMRREPC